MSILNENQLEVLRAVVETIVAPLDEAETEELLEQARSLSSPFQEDALRQFAQLSPKDIDGIVDGWVKYLTDAVPADRVRALAFGLSLLGTRPGSIALTGYFTEFPKLSRKQREEVLYKMSLSSIPLIRGLGIALASLTMAAFYKRQDPRILRAVGYPGPDTEMHGEKFKSREHMFPHYEFIDIPQGKTTKLECDVVVVGSGAGGGVVAAELAKAGKSVIVIEKGEYVHQSELSLVESDAFERMYEGGGPLSTIDGSLFQLQGSTWGGGTTVNWCASLRPPSHLREEWAKQNLPYFKSKGFQEAIETVVKRIGATTENIKHNVANSVFIEGCRTMGYHFDNIPQNTGGQPHECGWCGYGCRYGVKQGTLMTWLVDARDHGARFVKDCFVDRVIIRQGVAVGITGKAKSGGDLIVRAKKVVVSAGSFGSPCLLKRSGLRNRNIGKNLRLHPVAIMLGTFKDRSIRCYEGSIMTAISTTFENLDGAHYGAKLEVPLMHLSTYSAGFPWRGSLDHKKHMLRLNHTVPILVLSRDKDSVGSVEWDESGRYRVNYRVSTHDKRSILEGMIGAAKLLVAAGADEIRSPQRALQSFQVDKELGVSDPRFEEWLAQVRKHGVEPGYCAMGSAHQMGTCRMAATPAKGVVDPRGQTWEVKGLYVADASVFPTASGVNPMVTTEAVALSIANFIKNEDVTARL
ncbi:uncharacterized protein VTP21DRAFT_2170 [Calcarisporiella thermophila]|uniref:uncharacterized protein n=1 Tax=Calcarisporiella thermophila TaxID=911321 RepID=UPI00374284E3